MKIKAWSETNCPSPQTDEVEVGEFVQLTDGYWVFKTNGPVVLSAGELQTIKNKLNKVNTSKPAQPANIVHAIPMVTPIHKHNCDCCTFLGTYKYKYDLYYCGNAIPCPTVIARYGEDGDYISGIPFITNDEVLAIAAQRAIDKGLLTEELLRDFGIKHCGLYDFSRL